MKKTGYKSTSPRDIVVKNAHIHNLKNITVSFPRNKFTVITGLSGSGKSSLAFDTVYAEGRRRYVESLSSYIRQFLGKIEKPPVDDITGLSPTIAIEQKTSYSAPRSTVGTVTEIYDYLKLLFARIGKTYSPVSGKEVKRHTVKDVLQYIENLKNGTKLYILSPIVYHSKEELEKLIESYGNQGFSRLFINGEVFRINEVNTGHIENKSVFLLIDRLVKQDNEDFVIRASDSIETAFYEGGGKMLLYDLTGQKFHEFSNRFEMDGIQFEEPSVNFFTFNNPYGACKTCEGFGTIIGIDENLVIPNPELSVYEDAVVCWKGEKMSQWKKQLIHNAHKVRFPIHKPYQDLSGEEKKMLWEGCAHFEGINDFFRHLEEQSYKIQYRVMLSRYRGKTTCPDCKGTRLRKDASWVKIHGYSIVDFSLTAIEKLLDIFQNIPFTAQEKAVAQRLIYEITTRLSFLCDVGLGYLTLNRASTTLSGGETQRINLATSLGSGLVGSIYILDEPSVGLHPRDTHRLIKVLQNLKKLGNTVIVVEHDEEIIRQADHIIDMGPKAGHLGGEVVFTGPHDDLIHQTESITAKYLTGQLEIPVPPVRRKWNKSIVLKNARAHNLKNIQAEFPLEILTVITGVSGSGKSTLVKHAFYNALKLAKGEGGIRNGKFGTIEGDIDAFDLIEFIDQNPIGKSSRSNPVTYVKAFDEIRQLFANQPVAKINNFKPSTFSFNVEGGRCDACEGEGSITVEMQFMSDIRLTCESCKGKRFKDEVLEVTYRGKSVSDVLEMTVDEAIDFFKEENGKFQNIASKIIAKLLPLQKVGLGYVHLGQPSSTLSGGEAQRIKLASYIGKGSSSQKILFIFDEPTTGLHFHDVQLLLNALNELIAQGHSVIVIEHNLDVIKNADWIIDLGPEGGEKGGEIVFAGTPEALTECAVSHTGKYLSLHLSRKKDAVN
ncbi:MAG: excinuclease ABC subunit A [Bacteroidetes bacterium]|nr:MAG: excinuclease ABC subunit A [Bacteroidota bacterium]